MRKPKTGSHIEDLTSDLRIKEVKQLHPLFVKIDKDLYDKSKELLDGKYAKLMEAAIMDALANIKNKTGPGDV